MPKSLCIFIIVISMAVWSEDAKPSMSASPLPNVPRPVNQQWITAVEHLRMQPRAGEIVNGALLTSLADVFAGTAGSQEKALAMTANYERELLEKVAKWEDETKELRSRYEAQIIAELPEARREQAQKFLQLSRSKWAESIARDTKTRDEFLERMRRGSRSPAPGQIPAAQDARPDAIGPSAWLRSERAKAANEDEELLKSLRALLNADEAVRFDRFNRTPLRTSAGGPAQLAPSASPSVVPLSDAKQDTRTGK